VHAPAAGDRYTLYRQIAVGGMASVHPGLLRGAAGLGRPVAIKRLHPHLAAEARFLDMFLDEARLAMRVRHANVVSTIPGSALEPARVQRVPRT
jgi:serine/threonine-protein kinase